MGVYLKIINITFYFKKQEKMFRISAFKCSSLYSDYFIKHFSDLYLLFTTNLSELLLQ